MNPDEDTEDADVEAAVSSLMEELPIPVQNFLKSDERGEVARDLTQKYQLHVDQAGEFERAFLFMLLGIMKPQEFATTLISAGIPRDTVNGLAADVNERVFMRLRQTEREAPRAQPVQASLKPVPVPTPSLDYVPQTPTLPGSPVPAPMPATAPVAAVLEPTPVYTPTNSPVPQAAPGWHPAAAVHIYVPQGATMQHPAPMPTPVYQAPTPQAAPQQIAPAPGPQFVNPPQDAFTNSAPAPIPLKKDYGADPYRESF